MLKLYHHPLPTFSQRVRIALLEKQVLADLVEVDLLSRAQFSPEYLSKNPYGRVPAIEEDGLVLYESTAILEYLEATRPSPPLLPADVRSRAVVAMHLKLCDLEQFLSTLEVTPGPATALWASRVVERPSVRQTRPAR
jgi:glutathione S-transferase